LAHSILSYPYDFFEKELSGNIITKINDTVDGFAKSSVRFFEEIIRTFIKIAVTLITFYYIDYYLFILTLAWVMLHIFVNFLFLEKSIALNKNESHLRSALAGHFSDIINNIISIKIFNRTEQETDYIAKAAAKTSESRINISLFSIKVIAVQDVFLLLYMGFFGFVIIQKCLKGDFEIGNFLVIIPMNSSLMQRMYEFSSKIGDILMDYSRATQALEFFFSYEEKVLTKKKEPESIAHGAGDEKILSDNCIDFTEVSFSYETKDSFLQTLKKLNFSVKKKEKIALVGRSGSGKTTVAKLLMNLYDAKEGCILINGEKMKDISKDKLSTLISMIPQDLPIFKRSIRENLVLFSDPCSDELIIEVLAKVKLQPWIESLPYGLDTIIGDDVNLSGGQRQRLVIARVLLRNIFQNTPIVMMDEATAHLDSETEAEIQYIFQQEFKDKTVLMISHRLQHLPSMDQIIVFDKGSLVSKGAHKDLLQSCPIYQSFWLNNESNKNFSL
jgi:ABC-type multidrug transport system fused ATPase/permease subunit